MYELFDFGIKKQGEFLCNLVGKKLIEKY